MTTHRADFNLSKISFDPLTLPMGWTNALKRGNRRNRNIEAQSEFEKQGKGNRSLCNTVTWAHFICLQSPRSQGFPPMCKSAFSRSEVFTAHVSSGIKSRRDD